MERLSLSLKDKDKDKNEIMKVTVGELNSTLTQRSGAEAIKYVIAVYKSRCLKSWNSM